MKEKIQSISPIVDQFSRTISYLRLSLTDRCNLRCMYCMPSEDQDVEKHVKTGDFLQHSDLLTYEELLRVVRLTVSLGMNKLRLTGGEPLVRKGVVQFIEELSRIEGLDQIRLTTNGVLLKEYAEDLYRSGVRYINVSLDTLDPDKFKKITGRDRFRQVWAGLQKALDLGFKIKINVVAMKGVNDDEFVDFGRLALEYPFHVRFIEFMPVGGKNSWQKDRFIRGEDIRTMISTLGSLQPFAIQHGAGPARMYDLVTPDGQTGAVGFISPISHHFCDKCNRLRLTSEGKLRACLLKDEETDLKKILRGNGSDQDIMTAVRQTIIDKPQGHSLQNETEAEEKARSGGTMSRIGG
ncbi:GTP 3',8-cyclase MoaA [Desulforhopalus singaporensis]|uniref:GTP 3',8-cyclase MoaA n=1 Tax=Desulforhopalus singaporensis TaxID=91360 RepID=UPI001FE04887|nr:GTP 3',8-cyclase MoaA [Desulforhopalus singaporensis]